MCIIKLRRAQIIPLKGMFNTSDSLQNQQKPNAFTLIFYFADINLNKTNIPRAKCTIISYHFGVTEFRGGFSRLFLYRLIPSTIHAAPDVTVASRMADPMTRVTKPLKTTTTMVWTLLQYTIIFAAKMYITFIRNLKKIIITTRIIIHVIVINIKIYTDWESTFYYE